MTSLVLILFFSEFLFEEFYDGRGSLTEFFVELGVGLGELLDLGAEGLDEWGIGRGEGLSGAFLSLFEL